MATGRVPTTANSPLTAKGDLFGYSTTQARVPVGSDGETLVADSSASTGLRWQGNFAAGKNQIINGDFRIAQRGTSFSSVASGTYTLDRWMSAFDGTAGTYTISQQSFTPGTAPVAGYESPFFFRYAVTTAGTGGSVRAIDQKIEDVRTFAGQTITVSFWAKADTSRTVGVQVYQNFGSGGSGEVYTSGTSASVTTSWARYTSTISVPSISGKTIGASSFLALRLTIPYGTTATVDFWGVQVEAGNVATAFQTATGTLAGELAACQRYYARIGFPYVTNNAPGIAVGRSYSTTNGDAIIPLSVPLRAVATSVDYSGLQFNDQNNTTYALSAVSLNSNQQPNIGMITMTSTGMTANRMGWLIGSAGANTGYIGFSAEL